MDLAIDPVMDPFLMDPALMDPVMDPALMDLALMDPATTLSFPESEIIGEITATDGCPLWTGEI